MARRSTPQPPRSPNLSPAEKRSVIGRLSRRLEDLQGFDPQSAQGRRSPEVVKLEAAIKETLAAAFGHGTDRYNRYSWAADLEPRVIGILYVSPGSRPQVENLDELRKGIAERKQRAISLLQTAVQGLEEEFVPEPEPSRAQPAPTSQNGMSDTELRHKLLAHFYGLRHSNGGYVPVDDMIIPVTATGSVTLEAIANVCRQLGEAGLIEWTGYIGQGPTIGRARITGSGVDVIERENSSNEIRLPSSNAPAPSSLPVHDAPLTDAALAAVREVLSTIKDELPALTLSNSAQSEITADVRQIEIEADRPTPRGRFMKIYLESLRDNLAKAAGMATAGGAVTLVGLVGSLIAKHFGMF
jgi:hypothetical protein